LRTKAAINPLSIPRPRGTEPEGKADDAAMADPVWYAKQHLAARQDFGVPSFQKRDLVCIGEGRRQAGRFAVIRSVRVGLVRASVPAHRGGENDHQEWHRSQFSYDTEAVS
jgi:hypothetical protein